MCIIDLLDSHILLLNDFFISVYLFFGSVYVGKICLSGLQTGLQHTQFVLNTLHFAFIVFTLLLLLELILLYLLQYGVNCSLSVCFLLILIAMITHFRRVV